MCKLRELSEIKDALAICVAGYINAVEAGPVNQQLFIDQINQLLNPKKTIEYNRDKLLWHLKTWKKGVFFDPSYYSSEAQKDQADLRGWEQKEYLYIHLHFLVNLYVSFIRNEEMQVPISKDLKQEAQSRIKKSLSEKLAKEILIAVNAYLIKNEYEKICGSETTKSSSEIDENELKNLMQEFLTSFQEILKQMEYGDELCFPIGFLNHSMYLVFVKLEGKVELQVHEVGAAREQLKQKMTVTEKHKISVENVKPETLGEFLQDALTTNIDLLDYLVGVCKAKYEKSEVAIRKIFNVGFGKKKFRLPTIDFGWPFFTEQQTIENCVVENYLIRVRYVFHEFEGINNNLVFDWLIKREKEFATNKSDFMIEDAFLKRKLIRFVEQQKKQILDFNAVQDPYSIHKKDFTNNILKAKRRGNTIMILRPSYFGKSTTLESLKSDLNSRGGHYIIFLDLFVTGNEYLKIIKTIANSIVQVYGNVEPDIRNFIKKNKLIAAGFSKVLELSNPTNFDESLLQISLGNLINYLHMFISQNNINKKIAVLIDSLDMPFFQGLQYDCYDEIRLFMDSFLACLKQKERDIDFSVIMGTHRVQKFHMHSSISNAIVYDMFNDSIFCNDIGYTEEELRQIFKNAARLKRQNVNYENFNQSLEQSYSGFFIQKKNKLYQPRLLKNLITQFLEGEDFANAFSEDAINPYDLKIVSILIQRIKSRNEDSIISLKDKFNTLSIKDGKIIAAVNKDFGFMNFEVSNEDNLWSFFLFNGFLIEELQESVRYLKSSSTVVRNFFGSMQRLR